MSPIKLLVVLTSAASLVALLVGVAPVDPPANSATPPESHGTGPSTAPASVPDDIAKTLDHYRDLKQMTNGPVMTNVELVLLCRGASQWDVEKARKTLGPHAYAQVSIYMNDLAADAFTKYRASTTQPTSQPSAPMAYPVGSIVVKQKLGQFYFTDGPQRKDVSTLDGVGGMIKRPPGFDPEHGDWEYFYTEEKKPVEFGKIESCVKCHAGVKWQDHVFGNWARGM
jgi:hypothetical protein